MKGIVVDSQDLLPGDFIVGLSDVVSGVEVRDDKVVVECNDSWHGAYPLNAPVRIERAA